MSNELMVFPGSEFKSDIDVHAENVRSKINQILTSALSSATLTPHIALERVRTVLMPFHISIPKYNFMDEGDGIALFDVHQFGLQLGFDVDGNPVEKEDPDPLYVYFEYAMNAIGTYDVFCEVVNDDELDDLVAPDDGDEIDSLGVDDHYQINHDEHKGIHEASLDKLANYIVAAEKDEDKNGKNRQKGIKLAKKKFAKGIHKKGKVVAGTINEISVGRMKAYKAKAGESFDKARDDYDDPKKREAANHTIGKRNTGIWRVKAKTDHLKETSQEKIKNYIGKAKEDIKKKAHSTSFKSDDDDQWKQPRKVMNRKTSVMKAEKRLDETSDERKASYVKAADDQIIGYNKIAKAAREKGGFNYEKGPEQEKLLKQALRRSKGIKHVLTKGFERMHEEREDDARTKASEALAGEAWKKMKEHQTSGNKRAENKAWKEHQKHKEDARRYRAMANPLDVKASGFSEETRLLEMTQDRIKNYIRGAQASYADNAGKAAEKMIDGKDTSKEKSKMFKRLKGLRSAGKRNQPDYGI